ncbi:MAG: GDSL-type esterase/lipase family protein [Mucilaginibacter sp.]|uniref:GDSL-type esterase/lipase family protein n=1 Tax=Mucilaginibacter sp. TaxID=1882438 RepID=UPI0032678C1B
MKTLSKKILGLATGIFAFAGTILAQGIPPAASSPIPAVYPKGFVDSSYRPKITAQKIAEFKADPVTTESIVFLGNSITARCDWARLLNEPKAKNRGISGDLTFGVLERMDEVIAGHPKKIFILIGINDMSRNVPDSIITRNQKTMIARIRKGSPQTQIYFYTLLPVNASFQKFPNHYGKDEHILAINAAIRKFKAKNVTVIDLYPNFLDSENHLKAEYCVDGLHPNDAGYQVFAEILKKGKYLEN